MNEQTTGILAPVVPLLQQQGPNERGGLILREAIDGYMAGYAGRDPTRSARVAFWSASLGDVRLRDLDSDMIGDALEQLARLPVQRYMGKNPDGSPRLRMFGPRSPATLNRYAAALGAVLTWAKRKRLTPKGWLSPLSEIENNPEARGRERFLSDDELKRLLSVCRLSKWSRLRLLVLMAATTGARRGELLALRFGDLDLKQRTATVKRSKNGDQRLLPLTETVIAEMKRTGMGEAHRLIFGSEKKPGQPFAIDSAWRVALEADQRAGLRHQNVSVRTWWLAWELSRSACGAHDARENGLV